MTYSLQPGSDRGLSCRTQFGGAGDEDYSGDRLPIQVCDVALGGAICLHFELVRNAEEASPLKVGIGRDV